MGQFFLIMAISLSPTPLPNIEDSFHIFWWSCIFSEHWRTLRPILWSLLMHHNFKHISIGTLFVWLNGMPFRVWTPLNMLECMWMPFSKYWKQLNVIEHDWLHVNAFVWVWTCLNALYYWLLLAIECTWTPLSESEQEWMNLTTCEFLSVSI